MQKERLSLYILGDTATQLLCKFINKEFNKNNVALEIFEGHYNQVEQQVFDLSSELYQNTPQYIFISKDTYTLVTKFAKTDFEKKKYFADIIIADIEGIIDSISLNSPDSKLIVTNYYEMPEPVFGQYSNKTEYSFLYQLRKINFYLMELAIKKQNISICDVSQIVGNKGFTESIDVRMQVIADMPLAMDIQKYMALQVFNIINTELGTFRKCLILDLDNTIWGGVIGDDGLENIQIGHLGIGKAYTAVQNYAKMLKERGVILCVCSKNDEINAKEPFEKHPDMILRLDDIAVFVANWENKVDNINHIKKVLNIGYDSMVFVDDNPFERNMVKQGIPNVTVPDMPDDPAEYYNFLVSQNLFEVSSFSANDSSRTKQYQQEAKRESLKRSFANEDDFLRSLSMRCVSEAFNNFSIPRVAQLTQRSNQFNLRTIRYSEQNIRNISESNEYKTLSFSLNDKYGEHGLVAAIILEKQNSELFIDTWVMSCRVLKRGLEHFVLNEIVSFAQQNGFEQIVGEYIPTQKNQLVENHYGDLGFVKLDDLWKLDCTNYTNKENYITNDER